MTQVQLLTRSSLEGSRMIEINRKGKILQGRYQGWQVRIQDDSADSGGFLVLLERENEAYDDWVESREALERYFRESSWTIAWE